MNTFQRILSALLIFIATNIQSQTANSTFYSYEWEIDVLKYKPIPYTPEENVSVIHYTIEKNGKPHGSAIKKFNEDGKLIEYAEFKGEKEKESRKITYNEAGIISSVTYARNGKTKRRTEFESTETGKPSNMTWYRKDKMGLKNVWTYDENDCLKERSVHNRKDNVSRRYVHEYRDDCKLAKTLLYNSKGKVKHTWTYDCKSEGEQLEKIKKTDQICKWDESSKGILTKVYQTFDDKGRIVKNVTKFTSKDTLMLEWARYDKNDQLTYIATFDKDANKPLSQITYKKGKIQYKWEHTYENDMVATRSYYSRGKTQRVSKYIYNDENLLATYNYFDGKGKLRKTVKIEYP